MHYGWLLPDTAPARLIEKAHEAQVVVRLSRHVPCSREEDPSGLKKVYGDINEFCTLDRAAETILKELGVVILHKRIVQSVSLLTDTFDLGFILYTNHDLGQGIPSADDIARVGAYLGLTDKPQWWIGHDFPMA